MMATTLKSKQATKATLPTFSETEATGWVGSLNDEDVSNKKGIYSYVLTRKEKHLNIRAFTDKHKREAYEKQKGICLQCKKKFKIGDMEADHIKPWHEGGKNIPKNCQMLCKKDNREKSGI